MDLSVAKIYKSLRDFNATVKCADFKKYLRNKELSGKDVDEIIEKLCNLLLEANGSVYQIKNHFSYLLLPIVSKFLDQDGNDSSYRRFQRKCIALSILAEDNPQVLRFSFQYFTSTKRAPFQKKDEDTMTPHKKSKIENHVGDLEIVETCLRFLKLDRNFYRRIWNWDEFIERYYNHGSDIQAYHCNQIISLLFGMTTSQLSKLNKNMPNEVCVQAEISKMSEDSKMSSSQELDESAIEWKFKSQVITDIEGVFLPIFDKSNHRFYSESKHALDEIIRVDSTKINLRSLALGISSGKAICLAGPVGSGKTTLVEHLARKTGRLAPKINDFIEFVEQKSVNHGQELSSRNKRKLAANDDDQCLQIQQMLKKATPKSGFLRIQLGDQTDSKVLLGQYRCTDVPGEFLWQPGVLTQAVLNGFWLLLEDLDSATQDVCTVLSNLLENNFLSVPGFRENLKIAPGFQLFVSLRTNKMSITTNSAHSLLEKYLYTINILPLSRNELSEIICKNYPKLSTVSRRIVDVFLTFSSGCHNVESEDSEMELLRKSHKKKKHNGNNDEADDELPYLQHVSTANLPNSGRMVSTRDLLKLCKRSNPSFQVTSTECAYFVFQNCVDLFCSHLPAGEVKTDLIISIGARLGIIESRCVHLSNEMKPTVTMTSDVITVGRIQLSRDSKENHQKKMRMDDESDDETTHELIKKRSPPPTFSFTRISSCILERIAVSVDQNEPVLLVGETGVGKTSSIQYLAYQTNHKLVVVNMNNQSDVSDLIGGFKPVDISYVISPLRIEFEHLFVKTFDLQKNEKFLTNVSSCFNRGDFPVLVKLMLKVISTAQAKCIEGKTPQDVAERWHILDNKLRKLDEQLKNSINLSFAFIPGSLVNCIKNGDWVLLDEINLASTETLECLSTILEPNGSIILLERGDFMPIKRHPDFRIFSCMNPNTDVGKKDLPVGIRNRFTEFFVDELTTENDLLIIVGDYLNNTGIQKSRIFSAVKLYMKLREMTQMELNDGLGNKPVFSLRTLCRALRICAKNLCGSVERNIYESFCLSFLTQLDPQSHEIVLKLIQKSLISDTKKILSQQIPKPAGNQLNFEGYWIEMGEKEEAECKEYILTESVKKNLRDLARIISIGKLPILLQGPTSAGKTSLIEYIARRSGNYCLRINNHEHTDLQEYIGTYMADVSGKLTFHEGVLVKAMRNGYWIILDELNLAPSDILEALNRVLDDNRELYIPETQVVVKAHPNFMLFATQNPPGIYGGRKTLSRAFKNRFIELHFSEIPKNELEVILEQRCLIPKSYAQKMVKTMSALQMNRRTTTKNNFTLRDLFRWGNRYTFADKKLLDDKSYDWNQHLIDEGYLVLSAKVRNQFETEIIVDALYQNFRKKINVQHLFTLNPETSKVTKIILELITNYNGAQRVVWTFEMRRMAVLVSKSLQFNEPVLLVGPTGCGKTTVCQILAELARKQLRILNCHMHTEGADFIGGLRPHRDSDGHEQKQLFEWSDGPLILSMVEGNFFLADEISLSEDSVLERLNCVLEPERTILLAEKGGVDENVVHGATKDSEFVIKASDGFQFLATMNPGGDFGKKELSPALRNRFTEIWCTAINSDEDLVKIANNSMSIVGLKSDDQLLQNIAIIIIKTVNCLKKNVDKLNFSIRDVLAWANYITRNFLQMDDGKTILNLNESFVYGLQTLFLDALEMLPYENIDEIEKVKKIIIKHLEKSVKDVLKVNVDFEVMLEIYNKQVERYEDKLKFGISPFYLDINPSGIIKINDFSFSAPTTKGNLFRVLSALSLKKAILLEGPPGVGKTSLIENLANAIGYQIVRINLCEHTDLADLFGTDLPAESKTLEYQDGTDELQLGSFVWRDGPLLAALKSPNTWILLDELNLAPQSVLEGLNAILDHRGEVYIPELNKTFKLGQQTRIFAAQNPLRQGGGRKGLPQSFLNRFTKVYLRKLTKNDLLHVIQHNFGKLENVPLLKSFNLLDKMVTFSERLENGISNLEFGYKGGPFEANLRDILRWCKLLTNNETGFDVNILEDEDHFKDFMLVLFEKMKLVYCQRMRTEIDVNAILKIFGEIFDCDAVELNEESQAVAMYWNDSDVFLNNIQWSRSGSSNAMNLFTHKKSIVLSSQRETLKNITECVMLEKPLILCGPTDCGKTKVIDTFCSIFNKHLFLDTIDDSVTGSFQQFDFNRMLENLWQEVEAILSNKIAQLTFSTKSSADKHHMVTLFKLWKNYDENVEHDATINEPEVISELESFCKRVDAVKAILEELLKICDTDLRNKLEHMENEVITWQKFLEKSSSVLNSGGRFEWVDSVIVKSIKFGHFICLEHINLVSSAILDRLNPVLEPNGTLLISEKGVGDNNEPETIEKHENFRIFLTMDPKHGEISRAMRNRCIELSLSKETYTEDDKRKIVYLEGIHEIYLIRIIISIHQSVRSLSEFSTFDVSHLTKFAFLVAQNKAMGLEDKDCLLMSALEVYVRSSNVDLLGFGLGYYRNKLREAIVEKIKVIAKSKSFVNFENLVLKSDQLTAMKLVKLQTEPLLVVLRSMIDNNVSIQEALSDVSTNFELMELNNAELMPKFLLTFIYMISSFADIEIRQLYLKQIIESINGDVKLLKLNQELKEIVGEFCSPKLMELPWNSSMLPRLRPYLKKRLDLSDERRITLLLLLSMTLEKIDVRNSVKHGEIDVITYSKAVDKKILTDTVDNNLVSGIFKLLNEFKTFAGNFLRNPEAKIDDGHFIKAILSFLWFNRLLTISQEKLYINKSVNTDLIDQLNLHFKWFTKHCVSFLMGIKDVDMSETFMRTFQSIQNFVLSHHHPLKLTKKIYVKDFTNFLPFYDEEQVKYFLKTTELNSIVRVVPKLDQLYDFDEYQKRLVLMMSSSYQNWRQYLINNSIVDDTFEVFKTCWSDEMKNNEIVSELMQRFNESTNEGSFNFALMESKMEEFQEFLKKDEKVDFHNCKFDIEMLPIMEYFIIRILSAAVQSKCFINDEFLAEIHSMDGDGLKLIKILNDSRFQILKKILDASDDVEKPLMKNFTSLMLNIQHGAQQIIHQSMSINSKLCRAFDDEGNYKLKESQLFINSPLLTANVINLLMGNNGSIRGTGLGEINQWKLMLNHLKNVLWMNAEVNCKNHNLTINNFQTQIDHAKKLIEEIDTVRTRCMSIENENFSDFNKDFWYVISELKTATEQSMDIKNIWHQSFIMNSLCGIVELNLMTYLPLMDPVKKNQLKAKFILQDIDHLERLLTSYKFLSIMMEYKNLGKSNRIMMEAEIAELKEKLVKHSRKVALRPEIDIYSSMVKDVNHFLMSCCHPKHLMDLTMSIDEITKIEIDYKNAAKNLETQNVKNQLEELISKLDLWIANANKFSNHTLQQYQAYYRDFIAPIEYSITTTKNGFLGLRTILQMKHDAIQIKDCGAFWSINENDELNSIMKKFIEFPSMSSIDVIGDEKKTVTIFSIMERLDNSESVYFKLVKAKIQEIWNSTSAARAISPESFKMYDKILNVCNQMWQKQEELRRKKQEEEDSLYVTKTKCLEEDEETVKLREIAEIFPSYADEDFGEFVQNETLEQIIKTDTKSKKLVNIVNTEDYKFIGDYFISLMDQKFDMNRNYLDVFQSKLKVFYSLFEKFKTCLDNSLDDTAYKSLNLLVGLCQESYDDLQLNDPSTRNYNFYKDSNITEAIQCVNVLRKLEKRVEVELKQWPDHAVLNDLISIINRIRCFASNSPLVRFNTGLQILRQKVDEWNSVAHRLNNFKDIEFEIAELIQKWMRMELQCWRESLNQSLDMVRGKANRYWFFLYNLIYEFLTGDSDAENDSHLVDIKEVEKRFASDDVVEEVPKVGKISLAAVIKVLRQFMESSNYAEFQLRMKMLKAFENYLRLSMNEGSLTKKSQLIAILHNIHLYFSQFAQQVQDQIDFVRQPVEKKLKEFVKIESFNKDLSYFSMRSNIQRVHRHLHKILKEFELEAMKKITDLLTFKDSSAELSQQQNVQNMWKASELNLDLFIVPPTIVKLSEQSDDSQSEVLQKIEKYFTTSRKIVRKSIDGALYSTMIDSFQEMMDKELETCTHLRSLEVDRNQPRNKQKSQAKHILNQKRKALTDFFKSMTLMGVSYKTGLMTSSLNPDIVDIQIKPFFIESIAVENYSLQNRIAIINQKLDLYFTKCVFKIKILMNALLMPRPDMDRGFLERIKGFSIDFYMLVQDQRKELSANVNDIQKLQNFIRDAGMIEKDISANSFEVKSKKFVVIQSSFVKTLEILEQFKILMKCSPSNGEDSYKVIVSSNNAFDQQSQLYGQIIRATDEVLDELKTCINDMSHDSSRFKINVGEYQTKFMSIRDRLSSMRELFVVDNEYSIYAKPICDLHKMMQSDDMKMKALDDGVVQSDQDADLQLDNLAHSVLIAMQNIFKKFQSNEAAVPEHDEDNKLMPNHLKDKLCNDLSQDFSALNIEKINCKLSSVLDTIFLSSNVRTNRQISRLIPLLKQYDLLAKYFLIQQLSAHKLSTKMLSIMLSVFLELATKGFCVPQDLLSDEEQKEEGDTKTGEGFGFEDGEGDKDVSNKLESEDQLDEAKRPEDYNNKEDQQDKNVPEEKGIDMSQDFDGKMQDVDKNNDSDSEPNEDENDELDKEMGETEEGAEKLDDQVWGSDDEKEPDDPEQDKNEEDGKGSGEKDDKHNDLDTDNKETEGLEEDGLDAAQTGDDQKQKQKQKDIDRMDEQGEEEDQINPYHNELEEPPEPEDLNLDEDFNLDQDEKDPKESNEENPFDIDKMKDTMEIDENQPDENEPSEQEPEIKDDENGSDSSDNEQDDSAPEKSDENQENVEENPEGDENNENETGQRPDTIDEDEKSENPDDNKKQEIPEDYQESKDKQSKEQNVQSMPNQQQKGSHDDVQTEKSEETTTQDAEIDEQDTGEDRDGVGQAENEESKSGHQGIADTKETRSRRNQQKDQHQQKRKMGNTDEERTLGEVDKMEKKSLKTVEKLNREDKPGDDDQEMNDEQETDEYQHVKDAKKTDKTTMDNATEEQSKKIQHDENAPNNDDEEMESNEQLMETEEQQSDPEMLDDSNKELESTKLDKKSDKPSKSDDKSKERLEQTEEVQVDGENVITFNVPRGDETTAHCQMDLVNDTTAPEEQAASELLEMRKLVESEMMSQKVINPEASDMEQWQEISNRMMPNARELCEQLRLILEPTKCTRLKGDYRTGRRINMKKIIPYIASQFRKDKIWLRRTKAAQRDYKITIAVDDSKSMDHNNSKNLTLQAISLVSQALTLLESGKLSVVSFGEAPKIILKYNEQFNGPRLVKSLNFDQNQSRIAEMMDFSRTLNQDDVSSENGIFEHLLIVLSDGRNIFSEGEQKVRNAVKMARLQRMFIVYIIIDNPENKHSVLDIRVPTFSADKKTITMHSYMDTFPFPYYVIVRDLGQLPLVLSDGLRQWFELVNSEN